VTTVTVAVSGTREFERLAKQLLKVDRKDLEEEVRQGQKHAFAGLEPLVKASAAAVLPKRGGYAPLMAADVRVDVRAQLKGAVAVRAVIYARGKIQHRDVRAVNAGLLRHPTFGNRSAKGWKTQRITPGFADAAVDQLSDDAFRESAEAVQRVLSRI